MMTKMRRLPSQERGLARVELLLKAAEELIAELGYDRATTNAIAARAETSIGSLYQFFPNKEAIGQALVSRYMSQQRALFAAVFERDLSGLSLEQAVNQLLDPVVAYYGSHLDLTTIFATAHSSPELVQQVAAFNHELIGRLSQLLASRYSQLTTEDCQVYAMVVREVAGHLLGVAQTSEARLSGRIMTEAKRLIIAYLSHCELERTGDNRA